MIEIPEYLLQNKEPFFVCSKEVLKKRVDTLKGAKVEVFYSVKTNPEKCILEELQKLGVGFSASNPSEFLLVMSIGAKPENVIYYERGLTCERAKKLVHAGCRNFVVESRQAFDNLASDIRKGFTILVRINSDESVNALSIGKKGKIRQGKDKTKSNNRYSGKYTPGMDIDSAKEIIAECKRLGAKTGFLHHGSSQTESVSEWREKFEFLSKLPKVDVVDIGGGMPISYDCDEDERVIDEIKKGIKKIKAERIIAEPGRFVVGPACSLVAHVELVDGGNAVLNCSVYNVHIDTIIADLILPCRTLKQGSGSKKYRLLGSSLCNLDVFNDCAKLPKLSEGDVIVFDQAGAYNFSSDFGSGSGIKTYIV